MTHTRGAPYHPMTQGKIERWHRSMKNVVKLQHYYLPGELKSAVAAFVDYYNHARGLSNLRLAVEGTTLRWDSKNAVFAESELELVRL